MHEYIRAGNVIASFLKFNCHSDRIVTPMLAGANGWLRKIAAGIFLENVGVDFEELIIATAYRDERREINRGGHDETFVVIRMFADEIDSAGGAVNSRRAAIKLREGRC